MKESAKVRKQLVDFLESPNRNISRVVAFEVHYDRALHPFLQILHCFDFLSSFVPIYDLLSEELLPQK